MYQITNKTIECNRKDGDKNNNTSDKNVRIIFSSIKGDEVNSLAQYLKIFSENSINLKHIESRASLNEHSGLEIFVECEPSENLNQVILSLESETSRIRILDNIDEIPSFPRCIQDLDQITKEIWSSGELEADHPGFTDEAYRKRRKYFTDVSNSYKSGQPLPRVEYTAEEIATWGSVFRKLIELYSTHACKEYNQIFPLLIEHCGFREDNIPQLEDVSNFLKRRTGFQLGPIAGLISVRDFLAALAFRIFHATQYIRHPSQPLYTPEPDICHELLGHVAFLADSNFAQFAQNIGLASLGASDEYVEKLGACFWVTFEFGLCTENVKLKAYGGGLLSSFGELQYAIEGKAEMRPFDPINAAKESLTITSYQPMYYVAENLKDVRDRMIQFSKTIPKKFGIHYNPYTQNIEVLTSKTQVQSLLENLHQQTDVLLDTLKRV
ncbi:protein henna-like [Chrysoperla carnea]|uniref:protein henna-like n=1 Tax=Chrysoperla carnea TaxID=189513 RepID=UPI001D06CC4D|nr:protein henna-like [Chrysoperla carnea]